MTRLNLPVALAIALASQAAAQTATPTDEYSPQTTVQTSSAGALQMPTSIQYSPPQTPSKAVTKAGKSPSPAAPKPSGAQGTEPGAGVTLDSTMPVETMTIPAPQAPALPTPTPAPIKPIQVAPTTLPPVQSAPSAPPAPSRPQLQKAATGNAPATKGLQVAPAKARLASKKSRLLLWGGLGHTSSATNLGFGASMPLGEVWGLPVIGRGLGEFGSLKPANATQRKAYFALRGDLLAEYALGSDSAVYAGPGLELGQRRALGITAGYRHTFNQFGFGPVGAFVEGQLERAWAAGGALGNQGGLRAGFTYRF